MFVRGLGIVALIALAVASLIVVPGCGGDPAEPKKKESAELMKGIWLSVYAYEEANGGPVPNDAALFAFIKSASAKLGGPAADVKVSPVASVQPVPLPHYKLLSKTAKGLAVGTQVLIENPALYGGAGTQVAIFERAADPAAGIQGVKVEWLDAEAAKQAWAQ